MTTSLIDRARAYVAKMPEAVAGQNGHGATFQVARVLVHFFQLRREDAATILAEYNTRCAPQWSAKELNHKLESALKSKWEGPRASDSARHLGSSSVESGKTARTVRTGFCKSVSAAPTETGQSRTVRTDFLNNYLMRAHAGAHAHVIGGRENPSEASEPSAPPSPPEAAQTNESIDTPFDQEAEVVWRAGRIARPGDFSTRFTRYVDADGSVHHAHVADDDQGRLIRIGRKIYPLDQGGSR